MIRFNRKPGLFGTSPVERLHYKNSLYYFKAIVDLTYDKEDYAYIEPLIKAFQHIFQQDPIGPDDKPMKLGTFRMLGGTPDIEGNVYPNDIEVQEGMKQLPAPDLMSMGTLDNAVKKPKFEWVTLGVILVGAGALSGFLAYLVCWVVNSG